MIEWAIALLALAGIGGVLWYFLGDIRIRAGWQRGQSPLARYLDHRRRTKFNAQLPAALSTMSNALRAGFSLAQAFDSVVNEGEAPMCEEFAIVQQQLKVGMSFEATMEALSERVGSDDLTLVTTAILVSRKTGGNVTEIFDKISETIRGRARIERKVASLTAQGRMQGIVVSAMPFFLGAVMTVLKPRLMLPFLTSPAGVLAILVMIALITVGWLMILKIIKIDV